MVRGHEVIITLWCVRERKARSKRQKTGNRQSMDGTINRSSVLAPPMHCLFPGSLPSSSFSPPFTFSFLLPCCCLAFIYLMLPAIFTFVITVCVCVCIYIDIVFDKFVTFFIAQNLATSLKIMQQRI